jgi:hypothetical protein
LVSYGVNEDIAKTINQLNPENPGRTEVKICKATVEIDGVDFETIKSYHALFHF